MIGVFDSGSGGLTVLSALRRRMPRADIAYFGDIKNAPYGERSQEELATLTAAGMKVLQDMGATELVSACNTASASVLAGLVGHTRVLEMTRPLARHARRWAGRRALLLATNATVASRIYHDALEVIVPLDSLPLPGLARAIEFGASEDEIEEIVQVGLRKPEGSYDILIMGCTHYPLARDVIERIARKRWPHVEIIDPAEAVAETAARRFDTSGNGRLTFKLSNDSEQFRTRVSELFPDSGYTIVV